MNDNPKPTIKEEIVEVITSDKVFARKLADRMFWLLVYAGIIIVPTFCFVFYFQSKNGCILDFIKIFVGK